MRKGSFVYRAVWVSGLICSIFLLFFSANYVLESLELGNGAIASWARLSGLLHKLAVSAIGSVVLGVIVAAMIKSEPRSR
jgi:hypothetical protein